MCPYRVFDEHFVSESFQSAHFAVQLHDIPPQEKLGMFVVNETGDRILELGINSLGWQACTFLISSDGVFDGDAT